MSSQVTPQQAVEPVRPAVPTIWQQAGALVSQASDVAPELLARKLAESGFGWVAFKLHDADANDRAKPPFATNAVELGSASWLEPFRRRGIAIGGWGVSRFRPEEEAGLAATLTLGYGLAFYIADCELEFKASTGDAGRSAQWVSAFRAQAPQVRAALTSMPNEPAGDDYDFGPWRAARFRWLPQCYPNEFPHEPSQWPDDAQRVAARAFRPQLVHPMLGFYGSRVDPMQYVERLRAGRASGFTWGFSCFLAETMRDEEWDAVAHAVREGLAIAPPRREWKNA